MDSRLPKLIFVLLVLYAAVHFSSLCPQLPGSVAAHFNGRGMPNGWQTKSAFFGVFVGVSVLATGIGFAIPRIIGAIPASLINLPNKRYWLALERLGETTEFLKAYFAWFGCAVFLTIILTFDYAIKNNLHPEHPPDPARMWYVIAGFGIFTAVWMTRLFVRFSRPPSRNSS